MAVIFHGKDQFNSQCTSVHGISVFMSISRDTIFTELIFEC